MSVKRGATIVEVLLGIAMVATLTLATTTLYGFCVHRVMSETTKTSVITQASALADEIAEVIENSKSNTTVTAGSVTGLRCTIPNTGTDKDGDGVFDRIDPTSVDSTGVETYNTGEYVWFYMSDATGAFGTVGTYVWRAQCPTSANPSAGTYDTNWAKYYGGSGRYKFIDSVSFSVDSVNHCTTFTINASLLDRNETSASAETSTSNNSKISITRKVFWRYYR